MHAKAFALVQLLAFASAVPLSSLGESSATSAVTSAGSLSSTSSVATSSASAATSGSSKPASATTSAVTGASSKSASATTSVVTSGSSKAANTLTSAAGYDTSSEGSIRPSGFATSSEPSKPSGSSAPNGDDDGKWEHWKSKHDDGSWSKWAKGSGRPSRPSGASPTGEDDPQMPGYSTTGSAVGGASGSSATRSIVSTSVSTGSSAVATSSVATSSVATSSVATSSVATSSVATSSVATSALASSASASKTSGGSSSATSGASSVVASTASAPESSTGQPIANRAPSSASAPVPSGASLTEAEIVKLTSDGQPKNWPTMDKWMNWDAMKANFITKKASTVCTGDRAKGENSVEQTQHIIDAVEKVGIETGVNATFILATVIQESRGCVRAITTARANLNPGLMQGFGTTTCQDNPNCSKTDIYNMIKEGVTIPEWPNRYGLKEIAANKPLASNLNSAESYYWLSRYYNSGPNADYSADINTGSGDTTASYAADMVKRLVLGAFI